VCHRRPCWPSLIPASPVSSSPRPARALAMAAAARPEARSATLAGAMASAPAQPGARSTIADGAARGRDGGIREELAAGVMPVGGSLLYRG
jgi:hypothetical protein